MSPQDVFFRVLPNTNAPETLTSIAKLFSAETAPSLGSDVLWAPDEYMQEVSSSL